MPALKSRIDTRSDEFKANAAFLQAQVDDLRARSSPRCAQAMQHWREGAP